MGTALFPALHLNVFAPFLAIVLLQKAFIRSLWIACLTGLFLDLITSHAQFGFYALNFALVAFLLHKQRKHFFDDRPFPLSIFTALISSASTLLELIFLPIFERSLPISTRSLISDLLFMPCIDGIYALLCFYYPACLYKHVKKVGWRRLFKQETESS